MEQIPKKYQKLEDDVTDKNISLLSPDFKKRTKNTINSYDSQSGSYTGLDSDIQLQIKNFESQNETKISEEIDVINEINDINEEDYVVILRNIHKTYLIGVEGVPALRGVSLKVKKGEYLTILGTSGGGKTTLLNIIGTIDTPSRGDVKIFDTLIRSHTKDDILSTIRLDQVAFVFQSFNLLPNLNVVENVEIPMKIKGDLNSDEIRKRAIDLLDKVGLANRLTHFPNQLSGGEQQRVTIARALSNKPKILLLDEPTGDLDTKNSDIVMNILLDLNIKENITMIMVTHDVALKYYANRVVRVVDGKINSEYLIDQEVRENTIKKLKERINDKNSTLREGTESSSLDENGTQLKTFYRKATDYKIKRNNILA